MCSKSNRLIKKINLNSHIYQLQFLDTGIVFITQVIID